MDMPFDVSYGSITDVRASQRDVRFAPKSGHYRAPLGCPLITKSGPKLGSARTRVTGVGSNCL
jgi:hypothetical protein